MATIHFIGGEKGGVGKSVVSRLLAQYYIDRKRAFSVFDADQSHAAMLRYYADFSKAVDTTQFDSMDKIAEAAADSGEDVIVDLAAQTSRSINRWMDECDVTGLGEEFNVDIAMWHVMDDGVDSQRLLGETISTYGKGPQYVVVRNYGRGEDFGPFDESEQKYLAEKLGALFLDLPGLSAATMRKIDRQSASFWAAANSKDSNGKPLLGIMDRQRVKVWIEKSYAELDKVLAKKKKPVPPAGKSAGNPKQPTHPGQY